MNCIVHGSIEINIEGELPQDKSNCLAAFTAAHFDAMNEAVMNGQAEGMAFLHENGNIPAVTEGVHLQPPEQPHCGCGSNCQKEAVYNDLAELAEELVEELAENEALSNKERRFELYRLANCCIPDGGRGKGNRVELHGCITAEIHDFFPQERDDEPYVGFKERNNL
eukprot:CAMPEP_0178908506 /NCGR_PEP_ID=MMETSP0786-20121207/7961_1 /TAXON_ID=186022 /ORGANISM="Thalassionema frauenfeldii, Strain CCMP 1798" /LENGTH=166 /DNA_ID=CAMNT_0020580417 /DNA_START=586 /DNA_END=1086 /DNA_ORIENTATION=+